MRLAILGATGRVGGEIVRLALQDEHEVTALVRTPLKLSEHGHLTIIQGNALNIEDIEQTIMGADAVISALNTNGTTTLSESMPHIILSMKKHHIKRIVTIGTAGILDSRTEPGKFRYETSESKQKKTFAAKEHTKAFQMLKKSDLDWTVVCPTYLPDGEETGIYRIEKNHLPLNGQRITVGDTSRFAYEECFNKNFLQMRVGLAY